MPRGPKGEKRHADVVKNAVLIGRIATGDTSDDTPSASAAAELGRKGGKARANALSPQKRSDIAKKAADKRWGKD